MLRCSIAQLAELVRCGETTSTTLVEESLERASANAALNLFITLDADGALRQAARVDEKVSAGERPGELAGVPIVVKDNLDVGGLPTTAGTRVINYVPTTSASTVSRLEQAGAIVIGKANMHELAFGVTSNNRAFGAVGNPANPKMFPGGSSGGTAAAVAAGVVLGGLGSDTAGSVRQPASLCGVVGFRPTTWRVDPRGAVPAAPTFDVIGPIGRNLADVALLASVMTHDSVPTPRNLSDLRIGVARPQSENTSAGVAAAFTAARSHLSASGATLLEVDLSEIVEQCFEIGYPIAFYEMKLRMIDFLELHQPQTTIDELVEQIASDDVKSIYMQSVVGNQSPSEADYLEAKARIDHIRSEYLSVLDRYSLDAVAWPTAPLEAQPIDGTAETVVLNGKQVPTTATYVRNAATAGVIGAPGISLPISVTPDGLPVGFELDGRPDYDSALIAIGLSVEAALAARKYP